MELKVIEWKKLISTNDGFKVSANKESNRFIVNAKKKSYDFPNMLKDIVAHPNKPALAKHLIIRRILNCPSTQYIKNQLRQ